MNQVGEDQTAEVVSAVCEFRCPAAPAAGASELQAGRLVEGSTGQLRVSSVQSFLDQEEDDEQEQKDEREPTVPDYSITDAHGTVEGSLEGPDRGGAPRWSCGRCSPALVACTCALAVHPVR